MTTYRTKLLAYIALCMTVPGLLGLVVYLDPMPSSNSPNSRLFLWVALLSLLALGIGTGVATAMTLSLKRHLATIRRQKAATDAVNEELLEQRACITQAKRMAKLGYWRWDRELQQIAVSADATTLLPRCVDPSTDPITLLLPMIHPCDSDRFETDLGSCISSGEAIEAEYRLISPDGENRWIRQHVMTEAEMGKPQVLMATVQDISQQRNAEEQIRKMAYYDMLTGLATRASLNRRLNEMIRSARRRNGSFALFFIDLDKFKEVNDSLGHEAGDTLLIEIASRLQRAAREIDFVARLGGDEFCMLFDDVADEYAIATIANRCLDYMSEQLTLGGRSFSPRGSIGIARYPSDGTDARTLMQAGDNAMYAAKQAGMHSFEFHTSGMSAAAMRRLALGAELRLAISQGQFVLHYQPQVNLATGEVFAYEALIRWQHPERGLLPPGEFLDEIEQLGLIKEMGDWVIRSACQQAAAWQALGLVKPRISVNVAPRQLNDHQLINTVTAAIRDSGISPAQLEIEVTESGIQSAPQGIEILGRLRALGVDVAIDDFGTGYSSLGSLRTLPVNCLKIDRSFIENAVGSAQDQILLETIVSLGKAFDFQVIAVGVEVEAQLDLLRQLDCEIIQGYLFSPPLPPGEIVPGLTRLSA
ncbi:MAG: putative bifunctional diguanylate cyclase/phosphodiesterase [Pseudomonadota bacterium]